MELSFTNLLMETAVCYQQTHLNLLTYASPKPNQYVPTQIYLGSSAAAMKVRDLTLKGLSAHSRFKIPGSFFSITVNSKNQMATKDNQVQETTTENMNKKEEGEKLPPPPPPEKPEPGDCCGSGCIRCVWDVYYEELEAYNNLYKSNSKPS